MLLPRKIAITFLCFLAILAALGKLGSFPLVAILDFQPRQLPAPAPESPKKPTAPAFAQAQPLRPARPSFVHLLDPGHALHPFYQSLQRSAAGQGVTRILHYGDSPVTNDSITADLRELLQAQFGDSGHGFVLTAKPWAWYSHRGVQIQSLGWATETASNSTFARDRLHGLAGATFEAGPGAFTSLKLESNPTEIEIAYLNQPKGGTFAVRQGAKQLGLVDTAAPKFKPGWAKFPLAPASGDLRIEVKSGAVRLFGVNLERKTSGVVYSSLGLNGAQAQTLLHYFDRAHWTEQLQHYHPDLIVLNFGTNETVIPQYLDAGYPNDLRQLIGWVQEALPDTAILIMSPMDHGRATPPAVPHIVDLQRQIAAETGCAFFNTFAAMGGEGTMARWYAAKPPLVTADFIHPFPGGARKIGVLLADALASGYDRFLSKPLPLLSARQARL